MPDELHHVAFFDRGSETVAVAGLFDLAHDLHLAAQAVGRIARRRPAGLSDAQFVARVATLRLAQSILTRERNLVLDDFHRRWTPEAEL